MKIPHSAYHFRQKSASGRDGEFRRSAKKLLEFRIPGQILFKFRCSVNPDDPHLSDQAFLSFVSLRTCKMRWLIEDSEKGREAETRHKVSQGVPKPLLIPHYN